jgi:hypothetical protein
MEHSHAEGYPEKWFHIPGGRSQPGQHHNEEEKKADTGEKEGVKMIRAYFPGNEVETPGEVGQQGEQQMKRLHRYSIVPGVDAAGQKGLLKTASKHFVIAPDEQRVTIKTIVGKTASRIEAGNKELISSFRLRSWE